VNSAKSLESINIPVLDLYGSEDLPGVLETVDKRKKSAAHNKAYKQQVVEGASHFFDGYNDQLLDAVNQWLNNL
jgi:alpha/beta superfamily hydrolase